MITVRATLLFDPHYCSTHPIVRPCGELKKDYRSSVVENLRTSFTSPCAEYSLVEEYPILYYYLVTFPNNPLSSKTIAHPLTTHVNGSFAIVTVVLS